MPEVTPPLLRNSSLTVGLERRGIAGGRSIVEHQQQVVSLSDEMNLSTSPPTHCNISLCPHNRQRDTSRAIADSFPSSMR